MASRKRQRMGDESSSDRLQLVKAVSSFGDAKLALAKQWEALSAFNEDRIQEMDQLMGVKREELIALETEGKEKMERIDAEGKERVERTDAECKEKLKQLDVEMKDKKIVLDQAFKQYALERAKAVFTEQDYSWIETEKLVKLQSTEEAWEEKLKDAVDKNHRKSEQNKAIALNALKSSQTAALNENNLKHQAETAELKAKVQEYAREVEANHKSIEGYKSEIAAQRELTREVALAGKQGAINQSFGNK